MMSLPSRLFALAVVAFWMAPGVGALAVGLHVTLDHGASGHHASGPHHGDHHHGTGPEQDRRGTQPHRLTELARAALHGHHHGVGAVPDHEHDVVVDGGSVLLRQPTSSQLAVLASLPAVRSFPEDPSWVHLRSGPRRPSACLFTANCALLL